MDVLIANCRIFAMVCVALYVAHTLSDYTFNIVHAFISFGLIVWAIILYSMIKVLIDAIFPD